VRPRLAHVVAASATGMPSIIVVSTIHGRIWTPSTPFRRDAVRGCRTPTWILS
jgi:hypothetical protein